MILQHKHDILIQRFITFLVATMLSLGLNLLLCFFAQYWKYGYSFLQSIIYVCHQKIKMVKNKSLFYLNVWYLATICVPYLCMVWPLAHTFQFYLTQVQFMILHPYLVAMLLNFGVNVYYLSVECILHQYYFGFSDWLKFLMVQCMVYLLNYRECAH